MLVSTQTYILTLSKRNSKAQKLSIFKFNFRIAKCRQNYIELRTFLVWKVFINQNIWSKLLFLRIFMRNRVFSHEKHKVGYAQKWKKEFFLLKLFDKYLAVLYQKISAFRYIVFKSTLKFRKITYILLIPFHRRIQ